MYITKSTIVGLEETATYPIVVSVTQDLLMLLGLSNSTPVRFGDNPPLYLTKDTTSQNIHTPDILNDELRVTYTETSGEDYDISLSAIAGVTNSIYKDLDIRSTIKPLLNRKKLSFSINYYAKSKSRVTSIINRLRSLGPSDTRHQLHKLEYFYYMPEIVIELLDNLNNLKNTHTVPPVDLDDYLANTFNTSASILNSESGSPLKLKLVIRDRQQSVLGTIDTDTYTLDKDKDDESNRWSFNLEYSIEYELPNQLLVSYPITVYNQAIPSKFRLKATQPPVYHGTRTLGNDGLTKLTLRTDPVFQIPTDTYYLKIPPEDTVELPKPEMGYVRLFSVISIVSSTDLTSLFYLDEIPNIAFKADVLALIKLEASRMGDTHTSIFYMDIFNHENRLYPHKVVVTVVTETILGVVTERVKISTDLPLNIKGSYRVSFNVLTDVAVLRHGGLPILEANIATVDAQTLAKFSVIDSVLGIFDLDVSKLKTGFTITDNTTSMAIALNISNTLWNRVYTKQVSMILTEMLQTKTK